MVDNLGERAAADGTPHVPRNMALPWTMNSRGGSVASAAQAGPYAAHLGTAYDLVGGAPVSPKDILATIFHLLGIDPHTQIPNRLGQPQPIAGAGQVRAELFG